MTLFEKHTRVLRKIIVINAVNRLEEYEYVLLKKGYPLLVFSGDFEKFI